MAEIAECIINDKIPLKPGAKIIGNEKAMYQVGVKEIIGLYLLIPYLNNKHNRLSYDKYHSQVSIFSDDYVVFKDIYGNDITINNLRNTICHSFVSCELLSDEESYIVFDDRIIMSKNEHDKLSNTKNGNGCVLVRNNDVLFFLKKAFKLINSMNN